LYSAVSGNKENVLENQWRSRWRASLRNLSKENKNTKYENTNSKYENKRSLRKIQQDLLCDMSEGTAYWPCMPLRRMFATKTGRAPADLLI
jgi:hypothetical protein